MSVEEDLGDRAGALEASIPAIDAPAAACWRTNTGWICKPRADQIDDARRQVSNAENGLLPDLSLAASSVGNIVGTPAKSLDFRTMQYSRGRDLGPAR